MSEPIQTRHYSGDASRKFWARVKKLPAAYNRSAYALGVALQELEQRALSEVEAGERARELRKRALRG